MANSVKCNANNVSNEKLFRLKVGNANISSMCGAPEVRHLPDSCTKVERLQVDTVWCSFILQFLLEVAATSRRNVI